MSLGLVMGGGGPVGVAWYAGLSRGLADGGIDLRTATTIIGTSAGAAAGVWIGAGIDPEQAYDDVARWTDQPIGGGGDLDSIVEIFTRQGALERVSPADARELGALARNAPSARDAEAYVEHWRERLPDVAWPASLRVTAVDTDSGELRTFGADDGVELARGVAASAAAGGAVRPVPIDGRTYMDGGMVSGTCADLAADLDLEHVVVLAASDRTLPIVGTFLQTCLDREVAELRAAGLTVDVVTPAEADRAAMTVNLLDATRIPHALRAGRERGRALAEPV